MPRRGAQGPCRKAVAAHLVALRRETPLDTYGEALGKVALRLADLLDVGEPVTLTASWARELRAALGELGPALSFEEPEEEAGDGDDDRDAWIAGLSAPLRDASAG